AGVDDEQAAVGVLEDVGGAEVGVVGGDEVGVDGPVGRSLLYELVAGDFAEIEVADEEVVGVVGAEGAQAPRSGAAGGGGAHVRHDRHEVAGADVAGGDGRLVLAVDAAVDRVDEPVALAGRADLEKRAAQDALAGGGERDADGIIHAAGEDE